MKSKFDIDVRTKLLSKLDSEHDSITLEKLSDEYDRLINLKKDSAMIQKSTDSELVSSVNKISSKKKPNYSNFSSKSSTFCNYCSGRPHPRSECPARDAICNFCSIKGHYEKSCLKKKSSSESNNKPSTSTKSDNNSGTKKEKSEDFSRKNKKITPVFIHQLNKSSTRRFIEVHFDSKPIRLQIDSAADVSVISKETCDKMKLNLKPTTLCPSDASGNSLSMIGQVECIINFNNQSHQSTIYVSPNKDLNVFGNDLLSKFNLWKQPIDDFCVKEKIFSVIEQNDYPNFLKKNFSSCFEKSLGKCEHFQAHLTFKPDIFPPFIPARPAPYAVKPLIENELKRLQDLGVISPTTMLLRLLSNQRKPVKFESVVIFQRDLIMHWKIIIILCLFLKIFSQNSTVHLCSRTLIYLMLFFKSN